MCVYIHDLELALVVLDLPPVFSAQTFQDAVEGSDGLKCVDGETRTRLVRVLDQGSGPWFGLSRNQVWATVTGLSGFQLPPASQGSEALLPGQTGPDGGEPQTAG